MPTAAVPLYLGRDFKDASPGMRFGMYLRLGGVNRRTQALLWETHGVGYEVRGQQRQERKVRDENKVSALDDSKQLYENDKRTMMALWQRQKLTFDVLVAPDAFLRIPGVAIAPFTTGLGNEHPLENGFAFLNPYGLPYLPGSGVKGVLRQAARELASGDWGEGHGWRHEPRYPLRVAGKPVLDSRNQPVMLTMLDVLFGRETPEGESDHVRGALAFWDVIPQIPGDSLQVEIMTPHQGHYYQERAHAGSITPHESGQPIPISFLTVPPGSDFTFHVLCDRPLLARHAPDLADGGAWKALLEAAFSHAFDWLGFGAKTAVGYGAMARRATGAAAGSSAVKKGPAAVEMGPPPASDVECWSGVTLTLNPGNGELTASANRQIARIGNPDALRLQQSLPPDKQTRLASKRELKGLRVEVQRIGNAWRIISVATE